MAAVCMLRLFKFDSKQIYFKNLISHIFLQFIINFLF